MATNIDNEILKITLDNNEFEQNASKTLSTLDRLKQRLNFKGASTGIDSVNSSFNKFNASGMSSALNTVYAKFSALDVLGVTALHRIANQAITTGKHLSTMFTITPIKSGLQEYETQINAVQTILANTESKGTTLKEVNAALDELNTYADKTIYNFTEMTRNIGTFTAAGLDLKTSTSAIQGIANVAAVSGSTSQQASVAMYQLSQALSAGTVKLQDWNSVVNAGMGGQVFQDALKATAREAVNVAKRINDMSDEEQAAYQKLHGYTDDQMKTVKEYSYDVDAIIKKQGSFRNSLQEGWITSDVLSRTLNKFTTSGVVEYLSEMTGKSTDAIKKLQDLGISAGYDSDEFKKLSLEIAGNNSEMSKTIVDTLKMATTAEDAATKVKTFTQLVDTTQEALQSGWTQTWEYIIGDFGEAKEFWTGISNWLNDAITASADARNDLLKGWKEAGGRSDLIKGLSNAFEGLLSVIKPIKEAFNEIFPKATSDQLVSITRRFREFTERLKVSEETADKIKDTFKGVFSVLRLGINVILALAKAVAKIAGSFGPLLEGMLNISSTIGKMTTSVTDFIRKSNILGEAIEFIANILSNLVTILGTVTKGFSKVIEFGFSKLFDGINALKDLDFNPFDFIYKAFKKFSDFITSGDGANVIRLFNNGVLATLLLDLKKMKDESKEKQKKSIIDQIIDSFDGLKEKIEGVPKILDSVKDSLMQFQQSIKANTILKIAVSIGIMAISLKTLSEIPMDGTINGLVGLAGATAILMKAFSYITEFQKVTKGIDFASNTEVMKQLIMMAAAVAILSKALQNIAEIEADKLAPSMVSLEVIIASMAGVVTLLGQKFVGETEAAAKGISQLIFLSISIKILANALKDIASIETDKLLPSMLALETMLSTMAGIVIILGQQEFIINTKQAMSGISGLILVSIAMNAMTLALTMISKIDADALDRSLDAMIQVIGQMIFVMVAFSALASLEKYNADGIMAAGTSMIMISVALEIIAHALSKMALMSPEDMANTIDGMTKVIMDLVVFMGIISVIPNKLETSGALLSVAASMLVISKVLKTFSQIDSADLAKGLTTMGVSLLEFAVALYAMKKSQAGAEALVVAAAAIAIITPPLMLLSSLNILGVITGLIAMGGAFTIVGVAAHVLEGAIPTIWSLAGVMAAIGASVALVGAGIMMAGLGLSSLASSITVIIGSIVADLKILIEAIAGVIPLVAKSLANLIMETLKSILPLIPGIINVVGETIVQTLQGLSKYVPEIVKYLVEFLVSAIDQLAVEIPRLVQSVANFFGKLFGAIGDQLKNLSSEELTQLIQNVALMLSAMFAFAALTLVAKQAMVGILEFGALIAELTLVLAAVGALNKIPGLQEFVESGGELLSAVGTAIGNFVGGIVGGIAGGISDSLPKIGDNLSEFMNKLGPFLEGAKGIDKDTGDSIRSLALGVLAFTEGGLLEKLSKFFGGQSGLETLGENMKTFGTAIVDFSDTVSGKIDVEAIKIAGEASEALGKLYSSLEATGGVIGFFTGDKDLESFAKNLKSYGEGLLDFSESVSDEGFNPDNVKAAAEASESLVKMSNMLEAAGGAKSFFVGDNQKAFKSFGKNLKPLGEGIKEFAEQVADVSTTQINSATESLVKLAEGVKTVNDKGDIGTSFKTGMADIKKGLNEFKDYTPPSLTRVIDLLNQLAKVVPNLKNLISYANQLTEAATKIQNGSNTITSSVRNIKSTISSSFSDATKIVKNSKKEMTAAMDEMAKGMTSSINTQINPFKTAVTNVVSGGNKAIRSYYSNFKSSGQYLGDGLIAGVNSKEKAIIAAFKAIGKSAAKAVNKGAEINSPSKLTTQSGKWLGEGLIVGIKQIGSKVNDAASDLGKSTATAVDKAINLMDVDNGMNPTITPVVDLSNVSAANTAIDSMLNRQALTAQVAFAGDVNTRMLDRQNGLGNGNVIKAIDKLTNMINQLPQGNQYTVNGVTYDDGSSISEAVGSLVDAINVERRK